MPDDYDHLPVSPEELKQELYEAHGGPPSDEAVEAALEDLREKRNDFSSDEIDGADETSLDGDTIQSPEAHSNLVEALETTDECPICGSPTPKGGLPTHIVDIHSD